MHKNLVITTTILAILFSVSCSAKSNTSHTDSDATSAGSPSASPSSGAYACNDQQFSTDQSEFAAGTISGDQPVNICGTVTSVRPARITESGRHGYFYVQMPSGYQVEIVSNLDAMKGAPPTWPWVTNGDYVYVQGRYYYDNPHSQGVDWTEGDTGASWPHPGYVVVCNATGQNCAEYQ